jgi:hypothetical protein
MADLLILVSILLGTIAGGWLICVLMDLDK